MDKLQFDLEACVGDQGTDLPPPARRNDEVGAAVLEQRISGVSDRIREPACRPALRRRRCHDDEPALASRRRILMRTDTAGVSGSENERCLDEAVGVEQLENRAGSVERGCQGFALS
jgi:hypothetical protein